MDLDRFKKINDSYGYVLGDKLLIQIAELFKKNNLARGNPSYMGGDEFTFFFVGSSVKTGFIPKLNRILKILCSPVSLGKNVTVQLSGSLGVSLFPEDGETPEELLQHAEIAMYRAKENGGNQYAFFSQDMYQKIREEATLELGLQQGMEKQEFFLLYQPKVDLHTQQILGVEALVRWQRGKRKKRNFPKRIYSFG